MSRFAFVAAERANHAVATLCRMIGASVVRLLRLATRDPCRPGPGRGGGRVARPYRPYLRRRAPGLRLAAGPRRAVPGGPAAFAPAHRTADARDGPAGPAGPTSDAAHHRQPARPADCPQPAAGGTSQLRGRTGCGWPISRYMPTDEGWLYLAAIKDMATREIVGWSHGGPLAGRAVRRRPGHGPAAMQPPRGLIHHGDRGVQYAPALPRGAERHGIRQSMSRKGIAWRRRRWKASSPREEGATSTKPASAPVRRPGWPCSTTSKSSTMGSAPHSAVGYRTPAEARANMGEIALRQAA